MTLINPDEESANKTVVNSDTSSATTIKIKKPKRILHFSDGVLEEYSSDEEETDSTPKQEALVDPATLSWGPWLRYKTWNAGVGTLYYMDTAGEYLAAFFGITTPKYYFELEEYKKNQARNEKEEEERKGWSTNVAAPGMVELNEITTNQPKPVDV